MGSDYRQGARTGERPIPTDGRARRRPRLSQVFALLLIGQFAAFSILTLAGWGSAPIGDAAPPRMEEVGAPPGLISLYVGLPHMVFKVESSAARALGTAVFAGTAADWGGPEPPLPSFSPFHELPSKILEGKLGEVFNTLLFVVPSKALGGKPLYVAIHGGRYELSVINVDPVRGFALAATSVENRLLSFVGSSLSWLTLPAPRSIRVPLMVIAGGSDPRTFSLAAGVIARGDKPGQVMIAVHGSEVGAAVVATNPSEEWLAGFAEEGRGKSTSFIPASLVARALRSAVPSMLRGG